MNLWRLIYVSTKLKSSLSMSLPNVKHNHHLHRHNNHVHNHVHNRRYHHHHHRRPQTRTNHHRHRHHDHHNNNHNLNPYRTRWRNLRCHQVKIWSHSMMKVKTMILIILLKTNYPNPMHDHIKVSWKQSFQKNFFFQKTFFPKFKKQILKKKYLFSFLEEKKYCVGRWMWKMKFRSIFVGGLQKTRMIWFRWLLLIILILKTTRASPFLIDKRYTLYNKTTVTTHLHIPTTQFI